MKIGDPRHVQLQRIAARIAMNRVIAGVHFPVDNISGRILGQTLGEFVLARCEGTFGWVPRAVDCSELFLDPEQRFDPFHQHLDATTLRADTPERPAFYSLFGSESAMQFRRDVGLLTTMWNAACAECAYLR